MKKNLKNVGKEKPLKQKKKRNPPDDTGRNRKATRKMIIELRNDFEIAMNIISEEINTLMYRIFCLEAKKKKI